jgi:glycosyltransferase involved in cell wall biosynthesis
MPAEDKIRVYADLRWPVMTGIGKVMDAMVKYAPPWAQIVDLEIRGKIGSPLGPLALSRALSRHGRPGVFWNPGFVPPLFSRFPSIVTVHDLTHLHYYDRARRLYYNSVFRPLYRNCTAIICVSNYTRDEFLEWSGVPGERVHVVYNSVDPAFTASQPKAALPFRYVLYPGNHRWYKNLARLVAAYARSSLPNEGIKLALTGQPDEGLTKLAAASGVADRLHFLGRVPEGEMPGLYRGAEAIVFVSLYEGFGIPILEAFASGTPVLTSTVSAMPEVAGDAALLVDPTSEEQITAGLDRIVSDIQLRARLISAGRERLAQFSWCSSAEQCWSIVKQTQL